MVRILETSSDITSMEFATYAIQELLQHYGQPAAAAELAQLLRAAGRRNNAAVAVETGGLYALLPDEVQPIVQPFLRSKFTMARRQAVQQGVIFGRQQHSFRRWLDVWLRAMIDGSCGMLREGFLATTGVLKWDLPTMMFLLPYVAQNVLSYGAPEARQAVSSEVLAVVKGACGDAMNTVAEIELYVQTIFTLLDVLSRWVRDKWADAVSEAAAAALSARASGAGRTEPPEAVLPAHVVPVAAMLEGIPKQALSEAAFRCGAHARALQYFETYVRGVRGGGLNPAAAPTRAEVSYTDEQVSFLLDVYGQLGESDGLAGLVQLRAGGLTPADQILAAEKAGASSEALALYEQAVAAEAAAAAAAAGKSAGPRSGGESGGRAAGAPRTRCAAAPAAAAATAGNEPIIIDLASDSQPDVDAAAAAAVGREIPGAGGSGGSLTPMQQGHLRCLLQMGHMHTLLRQVDGMLARTTNDDRSSSSQLAAAGVAASWRLGEWDLLHDYIQLLTDSTGTQLAPLSAQDSWEVCIGSVLLAAQQGAGGEVRNGLYNARNSIMSILPAISAESYLRAYPHLVKLHMLQELEVAYDTKQQAVTGAKDRARRLGWDSRLLLTQPTVATQEPLLALRRQLAAMLGDDEAAGLCWLQHAKLCRGAGHYEAAEIASLEAVSRNVPGAVLERAKLLWDMEKPQRAVAELQHEIKRLNTATADAVGRAGGAAAGRGVSDTGRPSVNAKLVLQLANWTVATGQGGKDVLVALFEQAIELDSRWENSYFSYASYLDTLHSDARKRQQQALQEGRGGSGSSSAKPQDRLGGKSRVRLGEEQHYMDYLPQILLNYGKSVELGTRHILQTLPRLLTLFFDFGTEMHGMKQQTQKARNTDTQVSAVMKQLSKSVPAPAWLVVLPQLISRICHQQRGVQDVIQAIIARVTEAYPQQALWSLAAVSKSTLRNRQAAASNIILAAKQRADEPDKRLFDQFARLCDQLIKLCHWSPPAKGRDYQRVASAEKDFSKLVAMLPVGVMVPNQALFTVRLPPGGRFEPAHQAIQPQATIAGLKDELLVMSSLQRPKKLVFIGSDGQEYPFLAKPKDDLRKDYRLMDFAGVCNSLFAREAPSRRRNLYLRTYAVLPLTEDCGILQWINNLTPFKGCCEEVYTAEGLYKRRESNAKIKYQYDRFQGTRRVDLLNNILADYPPLMHKWFLSKFPEPAAWLAGRLSFTRTNAAWCMVGHMLGLGDRHGENIMIDGTNGDTFHVDFGCLFDRGLVLEVPEMVPFRMTQNVVDAFGVSGVEGIYRKCSEVTLQVLRDHKSTLMTSAETFLHDPLVDWTKSHRSNEEVDNPQAKDALATIEGRLSGTLLGVTSQPSLPLSCEGQAHRLITEATDRENLCRMYIWWMPWF